jgi:CRISPR/Cas system-associated endonuclease Cas1
MFKIIEIIDRLIILLAKWSIQREQIKAQKARDELLRNPSDWFVGHFNSDIQSSLDENKINKK